MYRPTQLEPISRLVFNRAIGSVQRFRSSHPRATDIVAKIYGITFDELVMMCTFKQKRWKNYLTTVKYFEKHYLDAYRRDLNSEKLLINCIVKFRCDVKSQHFYDPTLHQPIDTIKSQVYS